MSNTQEAGQIDCPMCGNEVTVKLSNKNGKANFICHVATGGCGFQGFARYDQCHNIVISKIKPKVKADGPDSEEENHEEENHEEENHEEENGEEVIEPGNDEPGNDDDEPATIWG